MLLAGDARAGAEIAVYGADGEDDFRRAIDLARGRVAAGVHEGGYLEALAQQRVHAHHRAAAARAMKADVPLAALKAFGHLDEIKRAAIILRFHRIGDFLQPRRGTVVLAGDFDAELRVPEDGVIVHGDAAIRRDQFPLCGQHQGVDLR